jgi:SAM-dependent methyltransferase
LKPLANAAHRAMALYRRALLHGHAVECPICGSHFRAMLPGGRDGRPNAHCPRCGSSERHRVLWLYLQKERLLEGKAIRMLHVAPEAFLAREFERRPNIDYVSGDLDGHGQMALDVTRLPFPDKSFDVVICSHVLEHVPDDRAALTEIRRVLRGWGVLQVPILGDTTDEDSTVTDPEERLLRFGQEDHVRLYGLDYLDRLKGSGFTVSLIDYAATLSADQRLRHCLDAEPIIFVR